MTTTIVAYTWDAVTRMTTETVNGVYERMFSWFPESCENMEQRLSLDRVTKVTYSPEYVRYEFHMEA